MKQNNLTLAAADRLKEDHHSDTMQYTTAGTVTLPSFYALSQASGIPLEDIAAAIYGRLRAADGDPFAPSMLRVLKALLHHSNRAHHRVYASQVALAEEAKVSPRSVWEALRLLRSRGIRTLGGEELLSGDGPHRARERRIKRRGAYPVDTNDVAGLWRFVPDWMRSVLLTAYEQVYGTASASASAFLSSLSGQDNQNTAHGVNVVVEGAVKPESLGAAVRPESARGAASAEGFVSQKSATVTKERKKASPAGLPPGVSAAACTVLHGLGIRGVMLQRIAARGLDWCTHLAAYGNAIAAKDGKPRGPGWYVNVYREWESGNGSWPDWFAARSEREAVAARRVVSHASMSVVSSPRPGKVQPVSSDTSTKIDNSALAALRARFKVKRTLSFKERQQHEPFDRSFDGPIRRDGRRGGPDVRLGEYTGTDSGGSGARPPGGAAGASARGKPEPDPPGGDGGGASVGPDRTCPADIGADTLAHWRDGALRSASGALGRTAALAELMKRSGEAL